MRGKDSWTEVYDSLDRITPAYAGKSESEEICPFGDQGSPPPMRGKVHDQKAESSRRRITPAYAGKSR